MEFQALKEADAAMPSDEVDAAKLKAEVANLYSTYRNLVERVVQIGLGPDGAAANVADVAQCVWKKVLERGGLADVTHPKAYLCTVARNEVVNRLRARTKGVDPHRLRSEIDVATCSEGQLGEAERRLALIGLSDEEIDRVWSMDWEQAYRFVLQFVEVEEADRRAFRHYLECEDVRKIAAAEGVSPRTVQRRLNRVRQALKDLIAWLDDDPDPDGGTSGGRNSGGSSNGRTSRRSNNGGSRGQAGAASGPKARGFKALTRKTAERLRAAAKLLLALTQDLSSEAIRSSAHFLLAVLDEPDAIATPLAPEKVTRVPQREQQLEATENSDHAEQEEQSLQSIDAAPELDEASGAFKDKPAAEKQPDPDKFRDQNHCAEEKATPTGRRTWLWAAAALFVFGGGLLWLWLHLAGPDTSAEPAPGPLTAEEESPPELRGVGPDKPPQLDPPPPEPAPRRVVAEQSEILPALTCLSEEGCLDAGRRGVFGAMLFDNHARSDAVAKINVGEFTLKHTGTFFVLNRELLPASENKSLVIVAVAEGGVRVEAQAGMDGCRAAMHEGGCSEDIEGGQFVQVQEGRNGEPRLVDLTKVGSEADLLTTMPHAARAKLLEMTRLVRLELALASPGIAELMNAFENVREPGIQAAGQAVLEYAHTGRVPPQRLAALDLEHRALVVQLLKGGNVVNRFQPKRPSREKLLRLYDGEIPRSGGTRTSPAATPAAVLAADVVGCVVGSVHARSVIAGVAAVFAFSPSSGGVGNAEPSGDDSCRDSMDCWERGRCTAADGACEATSDEDCRQSQGCEDGGRCTAADGKCKATSDEDCWNSVACKNGGRCKSVADECLATSDRNCRKSYWCKRRGECTADQGKCRLTTDEDCRKSAACEAAGLCTADHGKCRMTTDADCRKSAACKAAGLCTADHGKCRRTTDADCKKSAACKAAGLCTADHGRCRLTTDADCRKSAACKNAGLCTAVDGVCTPTKLDPKGVKKAEVQSDELSDEAKAFAEDLAGPSKKKPGKPPPAPKDEPTTP